MKRLLLALALIPVAASADTIYHCKAYSGGTFWASSPCGNHRAHIDRIATVPTGMHWDQQVKIAEAQRQEVLAEFVPPPPPSKAELAKTKCSALKAERDKIWSRYSNWQYQPPEVVGPDRQRTLGIQAEQRALGCPTQ